MNKIKQDISNYNISASRPVRTYNWFVNGDQSRINIHFVDGSQFSRTVTHRDAMKLCKEGLSCLPYLQEKYPHPEKREIAFYTVIDRYGIPIDFVSNDEPRARKYDKFNY